MNNPHSKLSSKPASFANRSKEFEEFVSAMAAQKLTYTELWNIAFGMGARFSQLFPDTKDRDKYFASPVSKRVGALLDAAPNPSVEEPSSGKLLLRLPKSLHSALADEARKEGTSMNQLILAKLAVSLSHAVAQ